MIDWVDRTSADFLEEMAPLCETIAEKVQSRYSKSVGKAARILGSCFHKPDILSLVYGSPVSGFTAHRQAILDAHERKDCHFFFNYFNYVCSLTDVIQLADDQPELSLLPLLSHRVHLAPVVQKVDNAIHQINYYPLDRAIGFAMTYPLDSDLSGG